MTQQASAGVASRPGRSELYLVVLLLVAGAGGVLLLANRSWLTVRVLRPAPFGPLSLGVAGRQLYPGLTGLAVVGLLAALLVLITGQLVRRILAIAIGIGSVWVGGTAFRFLTEPDTYRHRDLIGDRAGLGAQRQALDVHAVWAALTMASAVLTLVAGFLLATRAQRWTGGLARRYAAPAEAAAAPDPWRQLDRGEDPTISNG